MQSQLQNNRIPGVQIMEPGPRSQIEDLRKNHMIVKLTNPVIEKTSNYAYVCDPEKFYFVYGILRSTNTSEGESYLINVYGSMNSAYDIPATYFTIYDDSIPEDWEKYTYDAYGNQINIHTFPEWAHDESFYENLMNDEASAVQVFSKYAKQYEAIAKSFVEK